MLSRNIWGRVEKNKTILLVLLQCFEDAMYNEGSLIFLFGAKSASILLN